MSILTSPQKLTPFERYIILIWFEAVRHEAILRLLEWIGDSF